MTICDIMKAHRICRPRCATTRRPYAMREHSMSILQHDLFERKETRGRKRPVQEAKGKKRCTKCERVLSVAMFSKNRRAYDGLSFWCKECIAECGKSARKRLKAASWEKHYGLSEAEYWRLFEGQGGVCAICKQPETKVHKGVLSHLSVDHDHETGAVRGLLCMNCNIGIGRFCDDLDRMEQAIAYLRKWK